MRYHTQVPTYHVENFGCRATQADGAALDRQFELRGFDHAPPAQADLVILNTCTVTHSADQDARAAIRRVQRQNPNAKIVVTGCYAQRAPQEIAALPGVTAVIGNSHKHQLAELMLENFIVPLDRDYISREDQYLNGEAQVQEAHNFSRATSTVADTALAAEVGGRKNSTFLPLAELTGNSESRKPGAGSLLFVSDIFAHTELLAAPVFERAAGLHSDQRTRPNLKVQDGCDNRCSFCVIPYVRGQSRSLPLDQILREVRALVAAGYREVVISGINLGRWGRDLGETGFWFEASSFPSSAYSSNVVESNFRTTDDRRPTPVFEDLLRAILNETSLEKLRISSVEPMDWSDELIRLVAESPRIAKHAHVPLQSGSDAVLRRMHRKYRPWHYREKIEKIRAAMPRAAIGADVMAGFPGETEAEFDATRRFIEDLPFTYLHVFTFSARPGTPAAAMPSQVPVHIARERNRILREVAEEKKRVFMRSFIGQTVEAITLGASTEDSWGAGTPAREGSADGSELSEKNFTEALTDNYLKLHLRGCHVANHWIKAKVKASESDALMADIV
jgi:threonylcarbamoyladenosine tRNA methylthiotransferase MtaB